MTCNFWFENNFLIFWDGEGAQVEAAAGGWGGASAGLWGGAQGGGGGGSWEGAPGGGVAHESFSGTSSSLPAYNNTGYKQHGEVGAWHKLSSQLFPQKPYFPTFNESCQSDAYLQVVDLGSGLRIYTVGEVGDRPNVIWNYDMNGFNGGR